MATTAGNIFGTASLLLPRMVNVISLSHFELNVYHRQLKHVLIHIKLQKVFFSFFFSFFLMFLLLLLMSASGVTHVISVKKVDLKMDPQKIWDLRRVLDHRRLKLRDEWGHCVMVSRFIPL